MKNESGKLQKYTLNRDSASVHKMSFLVLVFLLIVAMAFAWRSIGFVHASSDIEVSTENVTEEAEETEETEETEESEDVVDGKIPTVNIENLKSCVMVLIVIVAIASFVTKAIKICVAAIIIFVILSVANISIDGSTIENIADSVNDTVQSIRQSEFFSDIFSKIGEFFTTILQQFGITI
jgi:hypothetical protein